MNVSAPLHTAPLHTAALLVAMWLSSDPAFRERTTACPAPSDFVWQPASPKAGSLFRVTTSARTLAATRAALTTALTATIAGEPLHFRVTGDSAIAIAAVPIDSTTGITMAWPCAGEAWGNVRIVTTAGSYTLERLRVAPRFGAPPDSATAERMRVEAERAAAVSRNAHDTPRLWSTAFLAPRPSRITSPFGGGRTFNGAVTSRHMGTDYAGAVGAPVRAANRGVVRIVDAFTLGGNVVYLDHGEGLVTAYLHLSKQLVSVGDTVARGDTIGRVGATGRVTGPHLHFIARYGTITVDPAGLSSLARSR
ncbi:M23 family metallopeptidase [Gemmatimonas groenlandica]|uniref:M23 family metallopeptidase n=1 Tax=Gemmatimonas groenlandica TaxID=2732249 RepID=A0A6M4IPU5_9BACT|nr:M23 family metallopeptidase [Gemmatimonas groenlandica]QJR35769.1 M23 family metallopeptidase [Gemmatimonas groenlandica]